MSTTTTSSSSMLAEFVEQQLKRMRSLVGTRVWEECIRGDGVARETNSRLPDPVEACSNFMQRNAADIGFVLETNYMNEDEDPSSLKPLFMIVLLVVMRDQYQIIFTEDVRDELWRGVERPAENSFCATMLKRLENHDNVLPPRSTTTSWNVFDLDGSIVATSTGGGPSYFRDLSTDLSHSAFRIEPRESGGVADGVLAAKYAVRDAHNTSNVVVLMEKEVVGLMRDWAMHCDTLLAQSLSKDSAANSSVVALHSNYRIAVSREREVVCRLTIDQLIALSETLCGQSASRQRRAFARAGAGAGADDDEEAADAAQRRRRLRMLAFVSLLSTLSTRQNDIQTYINRLVQSADEPLGTGASALNYFPPSLGHGVRPNTMITWRALVRSDGQLDNDDKEALRQNRVSEERPMHHMLYWKPHQQFLPQYDDRPNRADDDPAAAESAERAADRTAAESAERADVESRPIHTLHFGTIFQCNYLNAVFMTREIDTMNLRKALDYGDEMGATMKFLLNLESLPTFCRMAGGMLPCSFWGLTIFDEAMLAARSFRRKCREEDARRSAGPGAGANAGAGAGVDEETTTRYSNATRPMDLFQDKHVFYLSAWMTAVECFPLLQAKSMLESMEYVHSIVPQTEGGFDALPPDWKTRLLTANVPRKFPLTFLERLHGGRRRGSPSSWSWVAQSCVQPGFKVLFSSYSPIVYKTLLQYANELALRTKQEDEFELTAEAAMMQGNPDDMSSMLAEGQKAAWLARLLHLEVVHDEAEPHAGAGGPRQEEETTVQYHTQVPDCPFASNAMTEAQKAFRMEMV